MPLTPIRATKPRLLLCAAALLLSACDRQAAAPPQPRIAEDSAEDCLLLVWASQARRDEAFDRANDRVEGGAISCATSTSPSQFRDAIAAIKAAAAARDKRRMLEEVGFPLLYIDAGGRQRTLDSAAIEAAFDEIFDAETLGLLQRMDLERMTVIEGQGAFFELGSLWLVVPAPGARPRLVTVNRQALAEAAAAVRREASEARADGER